MKHFTILMIAVLFIGTSFAQLTKNVGNTPGVLSSVKSKSLAATNNSKTVVATLSYDGINDNSIGTGSAATFGVFALHPSTVMTPLVGNFLTEVQFYISGVSNVSTAEIQLYNDTTTAVYTQAVTGLVEGWNNIILTTSYAITADDLYVGYELVTIGGYPAGTDAGPRETNGYGDIMNFGSWSSLLTLTGGSVDANWNIKAIISDAAMTCFPPSAIVYTNTTFNSTDIAWTSSASAWNLKVSSTVIDPATGTGDIYDGAATTASYSLTGLTELTEYYVYIQTDCGSSTVSTWTSSSFTTSKDCSAPITAPWTDDMTSGIGCWQLYDVDGDGFDWAFTEVVTGNPSLNSFSYDNSTSTALNPDNWVISNKIDISSLTTPYLSWSAKSFDANYAAEQYSVYISTTGNTPSDFTTAEFNETLVDDSDVYRNISLASYSGDIWIAFRHHDTYDMFGLGIDNISVSNTTSLKNINKVAKLSIYPNPANELVTIANAENQKIIILDITGKVVYTIEEASKLQEINTSDFAAGTYIVRVNASVIKFNIAR